MKKIRILLSYVSILFIVETLLQVIFYSVRVKFFYKYNLYEKVDKIVLDALYVIGSIKFAFFLPLYLIFYLVIIEIDNSLSTIRRSVYHSALFLIIYLLLSFLLPGDFSDKIIDTIILTFIALVTSFFVSKKYIECLQGDVAGA
jgi:hypothetical protein